MANKNDEKIVLSLDTQETIHQIIEDIKKLQKKLKLLKINDVFDTDNFTELGMKIGQTFADSVQKAINSKKINFEKIYKDIKNLNNNLSILSSNEMFDTIKTKINNIDASLDSLSSKHKSDDTTLDLSSFLSNANTLKLIVEELNGLNGIG